MSADYTEIVVVLDRSGSMQAAKQDHEGGLQSFVKDQKELPGDVRFTLIQFDGNDPCEVLYDGVPISDVKEITLTPRGSTPLLDAVGLATAHAEKRLKSGTRPDQIVVMIITDGGENASREWTRERVKARIAELEKDNWQFLYLGANVDAFQEGAGLGIARGKSAGFEYSNAQAMYAAVSPKMSANRLHVQQLKEQRTSGGIVQPITSADLDYDFTEQERAALSGDKPKKPNKE